MGIYITTTVGVGFRVEEAEAQAFFSDADLENYTLSELLENYVDEKYSLLSVAQGGNSMTGDDEYVISVSRLEESWGQWDLDGGVYGFDTPVLELSERIQLLDAAADLIGREPKIGQFVAVHIY